MSTTALNLNTTTNPTSNPPPSLPDGASLLSNLKLPTTVIIQPPSSIITRPTTLLTKRYNPAELGDLLLKKIKSQNSNNNSNQHSPTLNPCLENNSMIEEVSSPSIRSFCEENDAPNPQKMFEGILMPQRSNTAPLAFNTFNLRHPKSSAADPHRQVQHALEVLQKKLLMDQQAAALKDLLLKVQLAQEPLIIPPLLSASSTQSSIKGGKSAEITTAKPVKPLKELDNGHEVYYGEIEYPLLSMAPPGTDGSLLQKDTNLPGSNGKGNEIKMPARTKNGSFESLSATRAETQRSESDGGSSYMSEESPKRASTKKNINKRRPNVNKRGPKQDKDQLKDNNNKSKAEVRRQRNDELLSPLVKGKKMTERKKNKWQTGEAGNGKQNVDDNTSITESQNNS